MAGCERGARILVVLTACLAGCGREKSNDSVLLTGVHAWQAVNVKLFHCACMAGCERES